MSLQVVFQPQRQRRGLTDLLYLAQIYDIYNRENAREFDRNLALAQMSGSPHEQYALYDQVTGISDWLFNTPMYQKKKHYEELVDKANELNRQREELKNAKVPSLADMIGIAKKIDELGKEKLSENDINRRIRTALNRKDVLSDVAKVPEEDDTTKQVIRENVYTKYVDRYLQGKGVKNKIESEIKRELSKAIEESPDVDPELLRTGIETAIKQKYYDKYINKNKSWLDKIVDKEYKKWTKELYKTAVSSSLDEYNKNIDEQIQGYQQLYGDAQDELNEFKKKMQDFQQTIMKNPEIITGLPEEDRNILINEYYNTVLNATGNQIYAADAANALIKTINPRLSRPIPYYGYMKVGDNIGSGSEKYRVLQGISGPVVSYKDAKAIQEALGDLGLAFDVVKTGTSEAKIKEQDNKREINHKQLEKLYKKVANASGVLDYIFTSDEKRAFVLNTSELMMKKNEELRRKGSNYRVIIKEIDDDLTPVLVSEKEYNNYISSINNVIRSKGQAEAKDYINKNMSNLK